MALILLTFERAIVITVLICIYPKADTRLFCLFRM